MDIPALSISLAAAETSMSVNIAVAKMAKENVVQQGADIAKIINSAAVQPVQSSSLLDISI